MARLKHAQSGAVVNVSDATAARLGSEWQPVKAQAKTEEKSSTTTRRRSTKTDSKS